MHSTMDEAEAEAMNNSSLRVPSRGNQMIQLEHQQSYAANDLEETKEPIFPTPEIMIAS